MATYKVIQDIEAEDKFVGPLTLKQFVFACSGILFGYLNIFAVTRGAAFLMVLFLPPMLLGFFLAIPWSRDQPTEMWVLAKLKFMFKPKKKLWSQAGLQELVTITAPKKEDKNLTKNYSQGEVKSRLKALAETIDSRGWAVKHATAEDSRAASNDFISDRLVAPSSTAASAEDTDLKNIPDMMDPSSNPLSGNLQNMINAKGDKKKDELKKKMNKARQGRTDRESKSNLSINRRQPRATPQPPKKADGSEQELAKKLKSKKQAGHIAQSHMRSIPSGHEDSAPKAKKTKSDKTQAAMTSGPTPDTIRLANNSDLNVATVAREANRGHKDDGEVIVPLH